MENWSSLKWHGSVNTEKPCSTSGFVGSTVCGVGIKNVPSESFKFKRDRATGLMLEPSELISRAPLGAAHAAKYFAERCGRPVAG